MLPPPPSLPLVARKLGDHIEDLLLAFGPGLAGHPAGMTWGQLLPDNRAYYAAVARLRKKGVVAHIVPGGQAQLCLGPKAEATCPIWLRPKREWARRWRGVWYLLSYDVPEAQAGYRKTLKTFVERERFGQYHRSVWVSFRDVRPLLQDLIDGASLLDFAMCFEARPALGISHDQIVARAWKWDRIGEAQQWYLRGIERLHGHLNRPGLNARDLPGLAHEEMVAYRAAMRSDPLLPKALHPPSYLGVQVVHDHEAFLARWGERARSVS